MLPGPCIRLFDWSSDYAILSLILFHNFAIFPNKRTLGVLGFWGFGLGRACTFVLGLVIISEADNGGARHERHLIRCTLGSLRKEGSIIEQRVRSWVSQGKRLVELFPKVIELAHVKLDLVFPELSIGLRECFYISISL